MDAAVAETVVRTTREQAIHDARADLKELRRLAVEAGRERSHRITKTSIIDRRTGEIRYNPAGRVLRDWYVHVYMNTLRASLGEPAVTIDAQQVEDTAALLHRIRPAAPGVQALQAVGVIRNVAVDDAAHAAAEIVSSLQEIGARRAIRHVADDRFDGDELRIHITRHWYLRAYEDHVHRATRTQQPLTQVTRMEESLVANALSAGAARELIGSDGIPRFTQHGTVLTAIDRLLAAGEAGLVRPMAGAWNPAPYGELREQVIGSWRSFDAPARQQWLYIAGSPPHYARHGWATLPGDARSALIRVYVRDSGAATSAEGAAEAFHPRTIDGDPANAARLMFAHGEKLRHEQDPMSMDGSTPPARPYDTVSADQAIASIARHQ